MRLSLQGTIHAAGTCLCLCLSPGGLRTGGCPGRCRPGPESVTRHGMAPGPENRYHGLITPEKEEMTAMKSIYLTCTPRAEAPGPAESAGCRGSSPPGAFVMLWTEEGGPQP